MAILTKQPRKQVIDLTGPAGNAFCLMGTAMKSVSYTHLTLPTTPYV